jgi:hypothetical protein
MKTTQILKAIMIGILTGAVFFFIPFPFRFFLVFFFIFLSFRFFRRGRYARHYREHQFGNYFWNPSYTQKWRGMSEAERKNFIQKMEKEFFADDAPLA